MAGAAGGAAGGDAAMPAADTATRGTAGTKHALQQFAEECRDFWAVSSVPRVENPSPVSFLRDFVAPNRPAVLTGLLGEWPALQAGGEREWTDDYLRRRIGHQSVTVSHTPDGRGDAVVEAQGGLGPVFVGSEQRVTSFGAFLDEFHGRKGEARASRPYLSFQNDGLRKETPELLGDIQAVLPLGVSAFGNEPDTINFWYGDSRTLSAVHKDPYENLYCVVRGAKRFTLLPPGDILWMYEREYPSYRYRSRADDPDAFDIVPDAAGDGGDGASSRVPWIPVDPTKPDLSRFPLFANATPVTVTVRAGEVLYLPALWYHHVEQEDTTVAVNFMHDMAFEGRAWATHTLLQGLGTAAPALFASDA